MRQHTLGSNGNELIVHIGRQQRIGQRTQVSLVGATERVWLHGTQVDRLGPALGEGCLYVLDLGRAAAQTEDALDIERVGLNDGGDLGQNRRNIIHSLAINNESVQERTSKDIDVFRLADETRGGE